MKTFAAPWGRFLTWVSILATAVCLFAAAMLKRPEIPAFAAPLPLLLLAGCALFVVRGYTLNHNELAIHQLLWSTRIPLADLLSAEVYPDGFKGCIRTCGNGGLYSFTGWFWSRKLRTFHAYVNDPSRAVVMIFKSRRIMISPADPQEFLNELRAYRLIGGGK